MFLCERPYLIIIIILTDILHDRQPLRLTEPRIMLNQYIDHTNLKANASLDDITKLCQEAIDHNFYAVCVNGSYLHHALELLNGANTQIAVVAGFPLGSGTLNAKLNEISLLVDAGADEIDMVLNVGYMKSGLMKDIEAELAMSRVIAEDVCLKLILETCYLTDAEIVSISKLAMKEGFDYIKTSTGFGTAGATLHHVELMKDTVGEEVKVKASGGIRDKETAQQFIDAGASRIGTSSGVKIVAT